MVVPSELSYEMDNVLDKWSKEIDGMFLPKKFLALQEKISNWDVNEEDVWICSFPKTGTTWTQEMVWLLMNDLDFKKAEENIMKRSPHIEASCLVRYPHAKFFLPFIPAPISQSLNYVKKQKSPTCIKTHLPWNLLPREIQKGIKKPKIIYISRNPKDTCLSYYHFSKMVGDFTGPLEEFANIFLAGKVNFAPFWNHVLPFWTRNKESNVLFLKYEDLKRDLPEAIRKTAEFLEKNVTESDVEMLSRHLSFESMSRNTAVNYDWLVKISNMHKYDENNSFMRRGEVGGHKDQFSKETIEKFDRWTEENVKDTGLEFGVDFK